MSSNMAVVRICITVDARVCRFRSVQHEYSTKVRQSFLKREKNERGDALPNSCSEGARAENRCQQKMRFQLASLKVYTSPQCPRSSDADRVPTGRKSRHGHVACTGKSSHRFLAVFVEPSEKGSCNAHSHTTMLGVKNSQRQSTKGGRVGCVGWVKATPETEKAFRRKSM